MTKRSYHAHSYDASPSLRTFSTFFTDSRRMWPSYSAVVPICEVRGGRGADAIASWATVGGLKLESVWVRGLETKKFEAIYHDTGQDE